MFGPVGVNDMPTYEVRCLKCEHPFTIFARLADRELAVQIAPCPKCGAEESRQEIRTVPQVHCHDESRLSLSLAALKPGDRLPGEEYVKVRGLDRLKIRNQHHEREVERKWQEKHGHKLVNVD